MGLDMYLLRDNDNGDPGSEFAYWRKANQIHNFFVLNVQNSNDDCGSYPVTESNIRSLLGICKDVLADNTLANNLLPTVSGFFFGSTDYDAGYYSDLYYTVEVCERALEYLSGGNKLFYHSSW